MLNPSLRRITCVGLLTAALFIGFSAPALAVSFTVHGWELGERIQLTDGRSVWTAELDVTLDGQRGTSFCVDADTHISRATYEVRSVLPAYTSPSPLDEAVRNFAWAGSVMDQFGRDLDALLTGGITRTQAITGVQAAIWEGIYGGGFVNVASLSSGASAVFREIMASPALTSGSAVIVELRGYQDQVFSNPVPEPTAAMVFGVGLLIVGSVVRRRTS